MIVNWFAENYVEVLGAITGVIYLYFSYNKKIWLWPFGILTSTFYVIFFYSTRLYADMSLQIYYVVVSIYGWYFWLRGNRNMKAGSGELKIQRLNARSAAFLTLLIIVLTLLVGYSLKSYTNASLPYLDAFTTAGGIIATWMLARKMLENWLLWIVVDTVAAGMYLYKEKYPTLILYLIFSVIAVAGYFKWKKDMEKA